MTKTGIALVAGPNDKREPGRIHDELHAPCGCAFHERPAPHWHPCQEHGPSPNAALAPLAEGPRRKLLVEVEVPTNWEDRLDMQWVLEREIRADRWSWHWPASGGVISPAFDFDDARKNHVTFYDDPRSLKLEQVDELIRKAVFTINESGWVWTAESCQGHPDASEYDPWASNTRPFLRLVCRRGDAGRMMSLLYPQMYRTLDVVACDYKEPLRVTVYQSFGVTGDWAEFLVYIEASTAWDRNNGVKAFERFADSLKAPA